MTHVIRHRQELTTCPTSGAPLSASIAYKLVAIHINTKMLYAPFPSYKQVGAAYPGDISCTSPKRVQPHLKPQNRSLATSNVRGL